MEAMDMTATPPARVRLWTRLEYERLIELGVFQPGERLELIDGLLLVRELRGGCMGRRSVDALRRALGDDRQIDSSFRSRSTTPPTPPSLSRTSQWCRATPRPTATRTRP